MKLEFCCPTLFGLEGIVADELRFEGKLTDVRAENGKVLFTGDFSTLAWANLNLRCAERVLIRLGAFKARNFEELFDGVSKIEWENWIGVNDAFPVKGHILNSKINSLPHTQAMVKKSIVKRLSSVYGVSWFEEVGAKVQIQFAIMNDIAEIYLDTTGAGLHKRGYRANSNAAPIRETLAAAMVKVARWRGRDSLIDPFCGSGTIAIEAAMIASKRAAGLTRRFDAEKWDCVPKNVWQDARKNALDSILAGEKFDIVGLDIDKECTELSRANAKKAGVGSLIKFGTEDAAKVDYSQRSGILLANPPYGERLLDKENAQKIYQALGKTAGKSTLKQYYLTSDEEFEQNFGFIADKKRKLYNGMIKCDLYMYFKPERKSVKAVKAPQNRSNKRGEKRSKY